MAASGLLLGFGVLASVMYGFWAFPIVLSVLAMIEMIQRRLTWRIVLVGIVGIGLGATRTTLAPDPVAIGNLAESRTAEGVVVSMPVTSGGSERVIVRIDRMQDAGEMWHDGDGRVLAYMPSSGPDVNMGDRVFVIWEATPLSELAPGYASYLSSLNVSGSARVWYARIDQRGAGWTRYLTAARRAISHRLQEAIPGDAGALAAGIVTGDDSALSDEARLWFRQTGTTHVTAVSGQNVALLVGFLAIWLPPRRRSTRWLAHGVMISSIWLYVGMVGLEAPALRAAIVATLMMLGSWFGRRPDPVTILALTLGTMALLNPGMTHQVGFLLSAAASWALCAAMPVRERPPVLRGVADVFSAVMAANIATLPILLWTFGEWSPVSLLANVLLGPVMTVAFPASYLLVAIGIPLPGLLPWLAWIPAIPLDLSLAIVHRLSGVLPLLHMPVAGASMVALISLPCFGALLLLSQDGDRWRQRISRGWRESDVAVRQVLAGSLVASVVAVAGLMFLGR